MNKEPTHPDIIRRPELQPKGQRTLFRVITAGAWGVWIYLLLPLISLLAWLFGLDYARHYLLNADEVDMYGTLLVYGAIIAAAALIIVTWSKYNGIRYRGGNRREAFPPVTPEMQCERFQVDRATLDMLHSGKVLLMDIDDREAIRCTWVHREK